MGLPLERAAKRLEIKRRIKLHAEGMAAEPADNAAHFLIARQYDEYPLAAYRGRATRTGTKTGFGDVADHDILHFAIAMHQSRANDARLALSPHDLIRRWNGSHVRHLPHHRLATSQLAPVVRR